MLLFSVVMDRKFLTYLSMPEIDFSSEQLKSIFASFQTQINDLKNEIENLKSKLAGSQPAIPLSPRQSVVSKLNKLMLNDHEESEVDLQFKGPVAIRRNSGVSQRTEYFALDAEIPKLMYEGVPCVRVTHTKTVNRQLKLNSQLGLISWNTKQSSKLFIDKICEIYCDSDAKNYREEFKIGAEYEQLWVTIIHQKEGDLRLRALHLIIPNKQHFEVFISSIWQLVKFRRDVMSGLALAGSNFVDVHWKKYQNSSINLDMLASIAKQMHVHLSRDRLSSLFDLVDKDKNRVLNYNEFKQFVELLRKRQDIEQVYAEYLQAPEEFMRNTQGEPFSEVFTLAQFEQYLLRKSRHAPTADLSKPLNCYFISSSHNTYLTGRQVVDGSSVESCIRALQEGCRCLELDCWDGSLGPIVYHGSSISRLTSSVLFSDLIEGIRKHAFLTSPYPLIISLEIRCSENCQLQIVRILKTILHKLLVTEYVPGASPEQLKHRILIKVKNTDQCLTSDSSSESSEEMSSKLLSLKTKKPKVRIVPELAELGVYLSGRKFPNFFSFQEPSNVVYSFSERNIASLDKPKLKEHNSMYLTRVYPSAYRITSTNFEPVQMWELGVQMVALNWQKYDLSMQLNTALFNAKIGYTLKPQTRTKARVRIDIISAQQLSRPANLNEGDAFSPAVLLEVLGVDTQLKWRTQQVANNGFNPQFNFQTEFEVPFLELTFAKFSLVTDQAQVFALTTVNLHLVPKGYRHLALHNLQGEEYIFSSLFVKFSILEVN